MRRSIYGSILRHTLIKNILRNFFFLIFPYFSKNYLEDRKRRGDKRFRKKSKQPRQSGEPCYHRVSALNEANYLPKSVQNMHLHVEAKERQPAEQNIELNSLSFSLANVVRSSSGSSSLEGGTRERFREPSHGITKDASVLRITYSLPLSLSLYIYIYIYKTI